MVTHDLAEAISMSDRIVVLSKRPSKIKKIYNIYKTLPFNLLENTFHECRKILKIH